jgi:zinc transporter ZupT
LISLAVAAGMMVAASYSLVMEGIYYPGSEMTIKTLIHPTGSILSSQSAVNTFIGFCVGLSFIFLTKKWLDYFGFEIEIADFDTNDINKMFLIIFVMTLHSLSEGIGIGVSFGE